MHKIEIAKQWEVSGKWSEKNPDGSWRWSIADLNAAAEERMFNAR